MKKFLIIIGLFSITEVQSQITYYYNPDLQAVVTANHAYRISNEELLRNKYAKVKEHYEKVNEKIAQILVIKEQLHSYLTNVHSLIANSRQLKRIYNDLSQLYIHLGQMSNLSTRYPQYAVFCIPTYEKVYLKALECQQYITTIILKEDEKYLLDMHNRQQLLTKIQQEVRQLNLLVYSIVLYIENAQKVPYWRNVPNLNLWYEHDKALIDQIIQQAGWL